MLQYACEQYRNLSEEELKKKCQYEMRQKAKMQKLILLLMLTYGYTK